jgi:stress-induced morphogen
MSGVAVSELEEALRPTFQPHHLEIKDVSDGCGAKFELIVVSSTFDGKPLLDRHRLVNECLAQLRPRIHALTMKTWTLEQWQARQKQES